jgi:hypothetical protein
MDYLAGVLSYLLPGLGQISQGRVAKGLLFLVSLHVLFFYGMSLGSNKNVFLKPAEGKSGSLRDLGSDLYARPHFLGQFWIGMAAWPAVYQYFHYNKDHDAAPEKLAPMRGFQRAPSDELRNELERDDSKRWDLGWVYTVIAGVLNLLVIYDAIAGPAFRERPDEEKAKDKEPAAA